MEPTIDRCGISWTIKSWLDLDTNREFVAYWFGDDWTIEPVNEDGQIVWSLFRGMEFVFEHRLLACAFMVARDLILDEEAAKLVPIWLA